MLENSEKLENTYQIRFQIDQRMLNDGGPMEWSSRTYKGLPKGLRIKIIQILMDTKSKPQSRVKKVQGLKTQYVKGQGHSFVVCLRNCVIVCCCSFWIDGCWGLYIQSRTLLS